MHSTSIAEQTATKATMQLSVPSVVSSLKASLKDDIRSADDEAWNYQGQDCKSLVADRSLKLPAVAVLDVRLRVRKVSAILHEIGSCRPHVYTLVRVFSSAV